jgi:hypothetical protein
VKPLLIAGTLLALYVTIFLLLAFYLTIPANDPRPASRPVNDRPVEEAFSPLSGGRTPPDPSHLSANHNNDDRNPAV